MTHLAGDHERDNKTKSKLTRAPPSMRSSSDADHDQVTRVMDCDDTTVLEMLSEYFRRQGVMPLVEQDNHAKHQMGTTSQVSHELADHFDIITQNPLDTAKSNVLRDKSITPPGELLQRTPPSLARHQPTVSRPGAFAHIPSGDISSTSCDDNDCIDNEVTRVIEGINCIEAGEENQEGLTIANLVEDHILDFAYPDSLEEPVRKRENKTKQYKTFVLLSVIFLLAVGAVLLAFLLPSSADTYRDEVDSITNAILSPSQAPTSVEEYVVSLFPDETTKIILDDSNSPQAKAFHWLLGDDLLHLKNTDEQIKQRFALATIYFATNGDEWTNNTNWLNYNVHECDWYTKGEFLMKSQLSALLPGFLSGFFSAEKGPTTICDPDGIYQHLWLDQNHLIGSLPDELYMLTNLQTISLAFNGLQGTISTKIGFLKSLEALGLMHMAEAGTIPTQIGLLTNLRLISIENNGHSGSIPDEIWQLTQLEIVSFSRNPNIKGTIPTEIGRLLNLRWFLIDDTGFSGTIPTQVAQLQYMEMLSMTSNTLSGTVPSELGLLSGTFLLGLSQNTLTGTIPTELGRMTSLKQLSFRVNQLEGPIPSQLGLLTNLSWTLNFRGNQLTGTIPSELGHLTGLTELEFRDNRLTGQIPSHLGRATSMGYLSFANNYLSGAVPEELYTLHKSLHTLSLEDNILLSGIIPSAICEINGTCTGNGYNPCEGPYGFSFNCSDLLCGCGCDLCVP